MVDAAIVMIENAHKHLEHEAANNENRWQIIQQSAMEVGPPVFFSLLIVMISFLPVFTLQCIYTRLTISIMIQFGYITMQIKENV